MTHYDFWFAPIKGKTFLCTIGQHEGSYSECLDAAILAWDALLPFGDALMRHPTTGETPDEFRAKHLYSFFARTPDGHEFKVECASAEQAQALWDLFHAQGYYLPARP